MELGSSSINVNSLESTSLGFYTAPLSMNTDTSIFLTPAKPKPADSMFSLRDATMMSRNSSQPLNLENSLPITISSCYSLKLNLAGIAQVMLQ